MKKDSYSPLSLTDAASENDDDDVEDFVDEDEPEALTAKHHTQNVGNTGVSKMLFVVLIGLTFVVGLLTGGLVVLLAGRGTHGSSASCQVPPASSSCDCSKASTENAAPNKDEEQAKSYYFLQTDKGKELLQSLNEQVISERSPRAALERIEKLMASDPQIDSSCHPLIHKVGRTAMAVLGGFEGAVLELRDDAQPLLRLCNAAYMHGTIEHYLATANPESDADSLQARVGNVYDFLCAHIDDRLISMGTWECNHGIGHGVIQYVRNQALDQTLKDSVSICNEQKQVAPGDCENGLWMDHFANTPVAGDFVVDEFLNVCSTYASFYSRSTCLMYGPTEYLLHFPQDYVGALAPCEALAPDSTAVQTCIGGVGMQTLKENMGRFDIVEEVCQEASDLAAQKYCFSFTMGFHHTATAGPVTPDLCAQVKRGDFQSICYRAAGTDGP